LFSSHKAHGSRKKRRHLGDVEIRLKNKDRLVRLGEVEGEGEGEETRVSLRKQERMSFYKEKMDEQDEWRWSLLYKWASWIFVGGMRRDVRPPDGGCRGFVGRLVCLDGNGVGLGVNSLPGMVTRVAGTVP
jgi:hypothetical protein